MKKLYIFIVIAFFLSSCVSTKIYESQRIAFTDSIQVLNLTINTLRNDTVKLNRSVREKDIKISEVNDKYEFINNELQINKSKLVDTSLFLIIPKKDFQYLKLENANLAESNRLLKETNKQLQLEINQLKIKPKTDTTTITKNFAAKSVNFAGAAYDTYISESKNITFFWKNKQGFKYNSLGNLKLQIEQQGNKLIFATNGGMYTEQKDPQGLYVENGKELKSIDLSVNTNGNFYMNYGNEPNSNGIFLIDNSDNAKIIKSNEYHRYDLVTKFATQSGPILLFNGKINPAFTEGSSNKKYRSGVGIINSNKVVFVLSKEPVNFYDFARIFRDQFKCQTAMYLDGEISKMYLPELNRYDVGGDFGVIIGIIKK